jgi:hypothetical protein
MRWTLKLELKTDDGATHAHELGSITRSMNDAIAEARYSVIESPLIFPSLPQLGG